MTRVTYKKEVLKKGDKKTPFSFQHIKSLKVIEKWIPFVKIQQWQCQDRFIYYTKPLPHPPEMQNSVGCVGSVLV
jgi:hypothetical protein